MYKIPPAFDLSELCGTTVQQICFTINSVDLFFDKPDHSLNLLGDFLIGKDKNFERLEVFQLSSDSGLLRLLEQKVLKVIVNEQRDQLSLEFENGLTLTAIGDPIYESFWLKMGNKEVLV